MKINSCKYSCKLGHNSKAWSGKLQSGTNLFLIRTLLFLDYWTLGFLGVEKNFSTTFLWSKTSQIFFLIFRAILGTMDALVRLHETHTAHHHHAPEFFNTTLGYDNTTVAMPKRLPAPHFIEAIFSNLKNDSLGISKGHA